MPATEPILATLRKLIPVVVYWKEAYNQVPRILSAMKHYNLGLMWYPSVGRIVMDVDGVLKHVL